MSRIYQTYIVVEDFAKMLRIIKQDVTNIAYSSSNLLKSKGKSYQTIQKNVSFPNPFHVSKAIS